MHRETIRHLEKAFKSAEMIWGILNCETAKQGRLTRNDIAAASRHINKINKVLVDILNTEG